MNNLYRYGGILYALLIVALIVAKLAGLIHWAWWAVLLPLTGPALLAIILAFVLIACLGEASARGENPFE